MTVRNFEVLRPMYIYNTEPHPTKPGETLHFFDVEWVHVGVVEATDRNMALQAAKLYYSGQLGCLNPVIGTWHGKPTGARQRAQATTTPTGPRKGRHGASEQPQRRPHSRRQHG